MLPSVRASSLSTPAHREVLRVSGRVTEEMVDQAARSCAVSLMRLCEALEHADADGYALGEQRRHRREVLRSHYRQWFTGIARQAVVGKRGSADIPRQPGDTP
jgi:hypothetical protein